MGDKLVFSMISVVQTDADGVSDADLIPISLCFLICTMDLCPSPRVSCHHADQLAFLMAECPALQHMHAVRVHCSQLGKGVAMYRVYTE